MAGIFVDPKPESGEHGATWCASERFEGGGGGGGGREGEGDKNGGLFSGFGAPLRWHNGVPFGFPLKPAKQRGRPRIRVVLVP